MCNDFIVLLVIDLIHQTLIDCKVRIFHWKTYAMELILFNKRRLNYLIKFLKRSFIAASTLSICLYSTVADKLDNSQAYKELVFNMLCSCGGVRRTAAWAVGNFVYIRGREKLGIIYTLYWSCVRNSVLGMSDRW